MKLDPVWKDDNFELLLNFALKSNTLYFDATRNFDMVLSPQSLMRKKVKEHASN